jgi:hypothetical protein
MALYGRPSVAAPFDAVIRLVSEHGCFLAVIVKVICGGRRNIRYRNASDLGRGTAEAI